MLCRVCYVRVFVPLLFQRCAFQKKTNPDEGACRKKLAAVITLVKPVYLSTERLVIVVPCACAVSAFDDLFLGAHMHRSVTLEDFTLA